MNNDIISNDIASRPDSAPHVFSCEHYKDLAKQHLTGKWGSVIAWSILLTFCCGLFSQIVSFPFNFIAEFFKGFLSAMAEESYGDNADFLVLVGILIAAGLKLVGGLLSSFSSGVASIGHPAIGLAVVKGRTPRAEDAFCGFHRFFRALFTSWLMSLFLFLWSLLLIVPGIIKGFSYAATFYVLIEYPELGPLDAITKSRQLMDGHKADLFILGLSFFGWILLVLVTCGLAGFYVFPYMKVTMAEFFAELIAEDKARNASPVIA